MARPKSEEKKALTDIELQLMNILWRLEGATVHEVLESLEKSQKKDYAYTTVSTMLRILEKKEFVRSEKEGRGHRYFPKVEKDDYQEKALGQMVEQVFSGQPSTLIKNLLGQAKLTSEELAEIQKMIEEQND